MMKTLFGMTAVAALLCASPAHAVHLQEQDELQFDASKLAYDKDPKTGLCYAATASNSSYGFKLTFFSYVPCTKEVEALIGK